MVKQLILIRHANAEDALEGQSDFERPLSAIGQLQIHRLIDWLVSQHPIDLLIHSDALRTTQTAQGILKGLQITPKVLPIHSLYNAEVQAYVEILDDDLTDVYGCICIVGHNPAISALSNQFSGPDFGTADAAIFNSSVDQQDFVFLNSFAG